MLQGVDDRFSSLSLPLSTAFGKTAVGRLTVVGAILSCYKINWCFGLSVSKNIRTHFLFVKVSTKRIHSRKIDEV